MHDQNSAPVMALARVAGVYEHRLSATRVVVEVRVRGLIGISSCIPVVERVGPIGAVEIVLRALHHDRYTLALGYILRKIDHLRGFSHLAIHIVAVGEGGGNFCAAHSDFHAEFGGLVDVVPLIGGYAKFYLEHSIGVDGSSAGSLVPF